MSDIPDAIKIVNRGKWLGSQANIKGRQELCWKVHDRANLLFSAHAVCMSYVIAMFLVVNCINPRNHLLYFVRMWARSTPKIANENL